VDFRDEEPTAMIVDQAEHCFSLGNCAASTADDRPRALRAPSCMVRYVDLIPRY
jgi:hypothetical protein